MLSITGANLHQCELMLIVQDKLFFPKPDYKLEEKKQITMLHTMSHTLYYLNRIIYIVIYVTQTVLLK